LLFRSSIDCTTYFMSRLDPSITNTTGKIDIECNQAYYVIQVKHNQTLIIPVLRAPPCFFVLRLSVKIASRMRSWRSWMRSRRALTACTLGWLLLPPSSLLFCRNLCSSPFLRPGLQLHRVVELLILWSDCWPSSHFMLIYVYLYAHFMLMRLLLAKNVFEYIFLTISQLIKIPTLPKTAT
jgi:hypothetical protein